MTLTDLLGDSYKDLVNAGVKAKMAEEPQNYFPDQFKGIGDDQSFYVEQGEAVVLFPKYSIAPGVMNTPEFRFKLADGWTVKPGSAEPSAPVETVKLDVRAADTFENADGLTMVPFRQVAEGLGYKVSWNQEAYSAELLRGAQWTSVSVGKDAYFFARMAPVTLGTAPVIQHDKLYVPVKFVTDILHADVTNRDNGDLHIEQK